LLLVVINVPRDKGREGDVKIEIDISSQMKELLNRNNVQIHSLEQIDAGLKEAYAAGRKQALILHRSKVYARRVGFSGDQVVEVYDTELPAYLKVGERLLVVLGTGGKTRFVLQTAVTHIFSDRFTLGIQDPRHTQRFRVAKAEALVFWPMSPEVYLKLQSDEVVLGRQVGGPITARPADLAAGERPDSPSTVDESLLDRQSRQPTADLAAVLNSPGNVALGVVDISLGGLCLAVAPGSGQAFAHQLLYVSFTLPANQSGIYGAGLRIAALAIARGWKKAPAADHLHLMFLARLPDLVAGFFSA